MGESNMMQAQSFLYESGWVWALGLVAAAVIVWVAVRSAPGRRRAAGPGLGAREQEPLQEQYSRGEISLAEYERRARGAWRQ
jgi:hypothetical protein